MPETVGQSWQRAFPADAIQSRAARAWASTHTGHPDAAQLAGELFLAVLATHPASVQMTVSTAGPRCRILAGADRRLPLHAIRGAGSAIVAALSVAHGTTVDDCGVWAELPWEASS
jgi:hypothetical protein